MAVEGRKMDRHILEIELFGISKWIGYGERDTHKDGRVSPRFLAQVCMCAFQQILDPPRL